MPATSPAPASSRTARASASSTAALTCRGGASTTIPARSPSPNGSSRRARSAPAELAGHERGQHVAGQPALGVVGHPPAQQLERDDRHGLVERQAVELRQRPARLRRDQPRLRRAARRRPPRARPAAPARGPRAPRPGRTRAARRPARARAAPRRPRPATFGSAPEEASSSPRPSKISAGPPISADSARGDPVEPLLGEHDPLEPLVRGERAAQDRVLLVDEVREGLLGERDERQLVGHLEQREVVLGGRLRRARRASSRARSRSRARAPRARAGPAARRTRAACPRRSAPSRSSAAARRRTGTASGPPARRCGPSAPGRRTRRRRTRGARRRRRAGRGGSASPDRQGTSPIRTNVPDARAGGRAGPGAQRHFVRLRIQRPEFMSLAYTSLRASS